MSFAKRERFINKVVLTRKWEEIKYLSESTDERV